MQADYLVDQTQGSKRSRLEIISLILPQMVSPEQVGKFLDDNLTEEDKLETRVIVGRLYNVYNGICTGHYDLDMRDEQHVRGVRQLAAISVSESKQCRALGINTSQRGNYSNFRNEWNGKGPIPKGINGQWFASSSSRMNNTVQFDYVSTTPPVKGTKALSHARFKKLISKLGLPEILEKAGSLLLVLLLNFTYLRKYPHSF